MSLDDAAPSAGDSIQQH